MADISPFRERYLAIKRLYPRHLILVRIGDFLMVYDQDAAIAARELGLRLQGGSLPMACFPARSADERIAVLIAKGFSVALCEDGAQAGE